jgi:hypothetical protein
VQPLYDLPRPPRHVDGPGKPPPDPLLIAQELVGVVMGRARWILGIALLLSATFMAFHLWPEPTVRAQMDFTALQDSVIRGNVESITISGTSAEGTVHTPVSAYEGEIIGSSQPIPDGVYSAEDMDRANAFEATIPPEAKESFIALLERQGVAVSVV